MLILFVLLPNTIISVVSLVDENVGPFNYLFAQNTGTVSLLVREKDLSVYHLRNYGNQCCCSVEFGPMAAFRD